VAATSDEGIEVLAASISEVIKFGQGGTGCPTAKETASGLEATVEGTKVTTVDTTNTVALTADVEGADVRSVEWKFGSEGGETIVVPAEEETQVAETSHKFATPGKEVAVEAVVHTDDLTTPEITFKTKLNVDEAPKVIEQPKNDEEVLEGDNAEFKAKAEGEPAPTVQWEVLKEKSGVWTEIVGATSDVLTVSKVTMSENYYEYRARFKNSVSAVNSDSAKLTVRADDEKAPTLTKSPVSVKVFEGEQAVFTAEASGDPTPEVQWEVSTDGGADWSSLAGATADTLTFSKVAPSQSGYEYRAAFTNAAPGGSTPVYSVAATLTVETKAEREAAAAKKREEEEAAAKKRQEEEAAALKKRQEEEAAALKKRQEEEAAAKKHQEEEERLLKKEANPDTRLASTSLSVSSSGALSIKVSCPAGTTCTGTITLRTLGAVSARISARAAKKSILTLATGSFTVAGGQSKTVTLHLSGTARKLLVRSHVLKARATIVAHDLSGASNTTQATVTLRPAKAKPHH
jgi:hypothetical protein